MRIVDSRGTRAYAITHTSSKTHGGRPISVTDFEAKATQAAIDLGSGAEGEELSSFTFPRALWGGAQCAVDWTAELQRSGKCKQGIDPEFFELPSPGSAAPHQSPGFAAFFVPAKN